MRITREIAIGIGIGLIIASLSMLLFLPSKNYPSSSKQQVAVKEDIPKEVSKQGAVKSTKKMKKVTVLIPAGSDSQTIAEMLYKAKAISSKEDFLQMSEALKVQNKFRAGRYNFNKNEDLSKVIQVLIQGSKKE